MIARHPTLVVATGAALAILVGCDSNGSMTDGDPVTESPPGDDRSATHAEGTSGDHEGVDWGPLAVLDATPGVEFDAGAGTGTVRIDEHCVTLEHPEDPPMLLVWAAPEVTWDEQAAEIVFDPRGGEDPVRVRDGDHLDVGGSKSSDPEADWAAEPAEGCPQDRQAVVHALDVLDEPDEGLEANEVEEGH